MNIAIVYSLPTRRAHESPFAVTDEDTKASAVAVEKELISKGANVTLIPVSEDTMRDVLNIKADCIFNLIEWSGLDTPLAIEAYQSLERLHIPMTGPTAAAFEHVANKVDMKNMLRDRGLLTPGWQLFETGKELLDPALSFPVIVKPLYEHCSIGLTYEAVVEDRQTLLSVVATQRVQYDQPVYAEEFIIGREFQVTVLEQKNGLTVLPAAEILFDEQGTRAFLTYASRWIEDHPEYETSSVELAKLTPKLEQALAEASRKAFATLNFADYSRLDIRTRNDEVFILEANPNPGLEDDEAYGMSVSFHAAGMTFADFLWEIVTSCLRRNANR
jgi:D-alanine-D-alanine ligase